MGSTRFLSLSGAAELLVVAVLGGGLALVGQRVSIDASARNHVWLAYPMNPAPGNYWIVLVWLALAVTGVLVQLRITARGRK